MQNPDWFDAVYFGHAEGPAKSNYGRRKGGYQRLPDIARHRRQVVLWHLGWRFPMAQMSRRVRVLDVGCAAGYLVEDLRACGVEAFGVDASKYILSYVQTSVQPYLGWADIRDIDNLWVLDHGPYDLICTSDLLEHVDEHWIRPILCDLAKLAPYQYHRVNTGERPEQHADGDLSHVTIKPLEWWRAIAQHVDTQIVIERT